MGQRNIRNLVLVPALLIIALLLVTISGAGAEPPSFLDIQEASVAETLDPAFERSDVANGREVLFRIDLAAPPVCDPSVNTLTYGFLIDSDNDPSTYQVTGDAYAGLGIDARITVSCDPGTGTWSSNVGTNQVNTDPGDPYVSVNLPPNMLPALKFHWIAYAESDGSLVRLPAAPDYQTWGIEELRQF